MEDNFNTIVLEDGIEYAVMAEIAYNEVKYLFLTNINDNEDFCIRKLIKKENKDALVALENDSEFDLALMLFGKEHKDLIEEISE